MLPEKVASQKTEGFISDFSPEAFAVNGGSPSKLDIRTSDLALSSSDKSIKERKKHV